MELLIDLVKYAFFGFLGLIALAVVFGKRIEKKWDFEADFLDARGREIGEFEVELTRIAKQETDYTLKAKFELRHPALEPGRDLEVQLEGETLMRAAVESAGRIRLTTRDLCAEIKSPAVGQVVTVLCCGEELMTASLHED